MHSRIIQIAREPIACMLNAEDVNCDAHPWMDYCDNLSSDKEESEREYNIQWLTDEVLPKGMFKRISVNELEYQGGFEEWKAEYLQAIQRKAANLAMGSLFLCGNKQSVMYLEDYIADPLRTSYRFCLSEDAWDDFDQSLELMLTIEQMEPGDKLYIGGILDYHW